jgi:hypothetical protein
MDISKMAAAFSAAPDIFIYVICHNYQYKFIMRTALAQAFIPH